MIEYQLPPLILADYLEEQGDAFSAEKLRVVPTSLGQLFFSYGYGSGYGDGSGDGDGYGYGSGYGSGYGY